MHENINHDVRCVSGDPDNHAYMYNSSAHGNNKVYRCYCSYNVYANKTQDLNINIKKFAFWDFHK